MIKTVVQIDGMACGMCEAHINDVVRKQFDVQKVTSSHSKGQTEIISESELEETALRDAIAATGYRVLSVHTEPYKKKGFLGLFG